MADISYLPGPLTAMVGDGCLALVETSPDSPVITRLWQQLGQGARADVILTALLSVGIPGAGGPGAGFALLVGDDDGQRRLYCRGAVVATVVGDPAAVRIDGAGLLTWREHVVPADAKRIILGEPPADSAFRLPAAHGMVLASCVIIDLAGIDPSPAVTPDAVQPGSAAFAVGNYPDTMTLTSPAGYVSRAARPPSPWNGGPTAPSAPQVPSAPEASRMPGGVTGAGPGDGQSDEYDYLWGATQARSVGDAAVGFADNGDASSGPQPPAFAPSAALPWEPPPGPWTGSADAVPPVPPVPTAPPAPPAPRAPSGLIDAVSWGSDPIAPPEPPTRQILAHRAPLPPLPPPSEPGEMDFTIRRSDVAALAAQPAPPDCIGPAVPALICPAGHLNPPSEEVCRQCAARLPADPVVVPRPVLGVLRLSVGGVIALDRGVVMGRSPSADFSGADGEERPHVVKLPSADGDVSRTHLRVVLDGWHVLVTDLHSTNGTLVTLPGRDPEQLRPGEPVLIRPGTVVRLADGIDFRYEVTT